MLSSRHSSPTHELDLRCSDGSHTNHRSMQRRNHSKPDTNEISFATKLRKLYKKQGQNFIRTLKKRMRQQRVSPIERRRVHALKDIEPEQTESMTITCLLLGMHSR